MTRKLSISIAFLLLSAASNAQTVREEWKNFLHPRISELSSVFTTQDFNTGELSTRTLAITSVSFNRGGIIELSAGYYMTRNCLYGLDMSVRPIDHLRLRAGIQKLPNLMEANSNLGTHPFVGFSQQVSYLGGYRDLSGLSTRGRDCGLSAELDFFKRDGYSLVDIIAGVYNGAGLQFKDIDDKKDFAGRVQIQPVKELKIAAGALLGHYSTADEDGNYGDPLRKQRLSAGLQYDKAGWFYRLEGIYGLTDQLQSSGISTYGGKSLGESNVLALKYDRFQTDIHLGETATTKLGAGFLHSFGHGVTFKGQYEHSFHADPAIKDSDSLSLSIMLSFAAQL